MKIAIRKLRLLFAAAKLLYRKVGRRATSMIGALLLVLGISVVTAAPAHAAYMHVQGNACPGGYIATTLYYYTANESGASNSYADNAWNIHLSAYDWDEWLSISVKCDNGVWYYPPAIHITGSTSPRYVGWI